MIDIHKINGNEIIGFLNKLSREEAEGYDAFLEDYNIVYDTFTFLDQSIQKDEEGIETYCLSFSVDFNSWGEGQTTDYNKIKIDRVGVQCQLDEPFEGSGADEEIEEALTKWLSEHEFSKTLEDQFIGQMRELYEQMGGIGFANTKEMDDLIQGLQKARSLMKSYRK